MNDELVVASPASRGRKKPVLGLRVWAQTTNLGVGSSNLFGRANQINILGWLCPFGVVREPSWGAQMGTRPH
jgi:hypothetical protein